MPRPMLRHFATVARVLAAALAVAIATAACGIKGPLTPAPKPEVAKDSGKAPGAAKP